MKICISHWKIRIRPGISEFFFFLQGNLVSGNFSFIFCFHNCAAGSTHRRKNIVASLRKDQFFSAHVSLPQELTADVEWREEEV